MPRHPLGERAMTAAERQAHYRVAQAAGAPVIRARHPADHRSRAQRWHDAVATLTALQADYAAWLESLPVNPRRASPRRLCRRSAISISVSCRHSNRHAASAGIEHEMAQTGTGSQTTRTRTAWSIPYRSSAR